MRRVCASVRIDVLVAGVPAEEEARDIAGRHLARWLSAGMPAPDPGVSLEVKHARVGRVARR